MKKKTCIDLSDRKDLAFPIKVEQDSRKLFTVTYKQVRKDLGYADAARELGECIFHALAYSAHLDNTGPE